MNITPFFRLKGAAGNELINWVQIVTIDETDHVLSLSNGTARRLNEEQWKEFEEWFAQVAQ